MQPCPLYGEVWLPCMVALARLNLTHLPPCTLHPASLLQQAAPASHTTIMPAYDCRGRAEHPTVSVLPCQHHLTSLPSQDLVLLCPGHRHHHEPMARLVRPIYPKHQPPAYSSALPAPVAVSTISAFSFATSSASSVGTNHVNVPPFCYHLCCLLRIIFPLFFIVRFLLNLLPQSPLSSP